MAISGLFLRRENSSPVHLYPHHFFLGTMMVTICDPQGTLSSDDHLNRFPLMDVVHYYSLSRFNFVTQVASVCTILPMFGSLGIFDDLLNSIFFILSLTPIEQWVVLNSYFQRPLCRFSGYLLSFRNI
jgi:hypothetical protein